MTLEDTLIEIWKQAFEGGRFAAEIEGRRYPIWKTRTKKLRTVEFDYGGHRITGIEQNPQTTSRWAELARQGKRIMQFSVEGRYIGNVCEGKLTRYAAWSALGLPE